MADSTLDHQLMEAAATGAADKINGLIEEGADPGYQDEEGVSPLMRAAENGHLDAVVALLEAGAPWNAQDNEGYCAGEYATAGKNRDIIELIMQWAVQSELILGAMTRKASVGSAAGASNADYLQQKLQYTDDGDKLLDADGEAVMMGWEGPLMVKHADIICANGGDILNVGFGLGLIDDEIQKHNPRSHTIIEAHPDVYAHMKEIGWDKRPGVTILFGRWQDVLPQLKQYDGIFFDTYGEYYEELREFQRQLPQLLKPTGIYSFFNGLASDNFFFHSVYSQIVQVELHALGISTSYEMVRVDSIKDDTWQGVRSKYWHFDVYMLPTCKKVEKEEQQQQQQQQEKEEEEEAK